MTDKQQQAAAAQFAEEWKGRGYEKGESQPFWMALLHNVYGVEHAEKYISFENQVKLASTSFIDGYIEDTHVLIEQKSIDKDLRKPIKQSDGTLLTPFEQAKRYANEMSYSKRPRWVVVCNFQSFLVYDMEHPNSEPEEILLENLATDYYRLQFLVDNQSVHIKKEMEVSIKAGELVGQLYDEILKQYLDPSSPDTLRSLNVLCVRLVFCLYAEDAGVFGRHGMFGDYLTHFTPDRLRTALIDLFSVLNTPVEKRDPYMDDLLAAFPYVGGELFADEHIEIPRLNERTCDLLIRKASDDFDWSQISPTIFGAVFESTLNPETRRSGGMHYTSIENIHKVIDPLFMDELYEEFDAILAEKVERTRMRQLAAFQDKLGSLTFLDPACGSGNFLTETYVSLRRLENRVISQLNQGQAMLGAFVNPIKVDIHQFYGIEINDFAVTVATTALWIAEAQMMAETERIVHMNLDCLPLKSYTNIKEGNALRIDWNEVVPASQLNYIIGNPPFVGHQWRKESQVEDMDLIFSNFENYGKLDYVACWYKKSADFILGTPINVAFVSTNSICQGESVAMMWKPLFEKYNLDITFAWQTFVWDSEATDKAHVHVVIIGFSTNAASRNKYLFKDGEKKIAKHINGYLYDAPNIFIENRGKSLTNNMPKMTKGSQATDGSNLILTTDERESLIKRYPNTSSFIKRIIGAEDFINNKYRYCLWLKGVSPKEYAHISFITERLRNVADLRRKSPTKSVQKDAETPMLFTQIRQPETDYLVIPRISSYQRRYIPIGYMSKEVIANDKVMFIPSASLLLFGVLTSNVHMAWMRVTAGRLKSDYSYTPAVYNNFPWPTPTDAQKAKIEQTAQAILDARALYPDSSLADLYDEVTMPPELRRAHQQNDRAVMEAYGFPTSRDFTESDCVARLFEMYKLLTQ